MTEKCGLSCIIAAVLCLGLLHCLAAHAETPGREKNRNIKKLMELQGRLPDLKLKIERHIEAYCEKVPGLPPEFAENMKKGINEKDLEALIDKFVSAYDKHFTDEEIAALLKFYESPVGQKVLKAMPQITAEQSAMAMEWAQSCAVRVTDNLSGLTRAVATGDTAKAKDLLAGGVKVNQSDSEGVTPLMVAAYRGNTDMAKLVVEKGADVNARAKRGSTPLIAAVQSGNKELVKFLLDKGADANAKEELGLNAYQLASIKKQPELMALLRDKTDDKKPVRVSFVVSSLGKSKDCLPVMSLASDSSKKVTCLKLGQEVLPIPRVPKNNGWTLIQYPKLGWVRSESFKEMLVRGEQKRRITEEPQELIRSSSQVEAKRSGESPTTEQTPVSKVPEGPRIWWRH